MNIEQAKQDFSKYINNADPDVGLWEVYQSFVAEKMKLDKYFSIFLDDNADEMDKCDTYDSPAWKTYKEKLKEYHAIETNLKHTQYFLNKHV
jgi:hypothetical protein